MCNPRNAGYKALSRVLVFRFALTPPRKPNGKPGFNDPRFLMLLELRDTRFLLGGW